MRRNSEEKFIVEELSEDILNNLPEEFQHWEYFFLQKPLVKLLKQISGELPNELIAELKGISEGTSREYPSGTSIQNPRETFGETPKGAYKLTLEGISGRTCRKIPTETLRGASIRNIRGTSERAL